MKNPKCIFISLFITVNSLKGFSQTLNTIDSLKQINQACLDSGWHMSSCEYEYLTQLDSILNVVYERLQLQFTSSAKEDLKKEQLNWLRRRNILYKKSEQEYEDSLRTKSWGPKMRVVTIGEKADFVERRVIELIKRLEN